MLISLDLPDEFIHVSADSWSKDLHRLEDSIRIDQEAAAHIHTRICIIDSIGCANPPAAIGKHRERDASGDHFREFFFLPNLMGKTAVGACRKHLDVQRLQFIISGGNCREFCRSNVGEITRIKAQNDPFSSKI